MVLTAKSFPGRKPEGMKAERRFRQSLPDTTNA
jgi:hypothetical protein